MDKLKGEKTTRTRRLPFRQILVKNGDFYILDFEGEPESTIRDRKVKQPPLKDVAGLFRSFHYAIYATIFNNGDKYPQSEELFQAGELLYRYFIGVFLETYTVKFRMPTSTLATAKERIYVLKYSLLEKAVYELGYEMNARPLWAVIPLEGISSIMKLD